MTVALGAAVGLELFHRLDERVKKLASLGFMCRQMLSLIESEGVSLIDIASRLSQQHGLMRICCESMEEGESFRSAFLCAVEAQRELREEEKECLRVLGESLGRCSELSQKRIIDATIERLQAFEAAARKEKSEKSRLCLSGGALVGAFAAVLML